MDANLAEYWHFKDDVSRIYIKKTAADQKSEWFYLDEEEDLKQLLDSLNPRGIREKRLTEAIRKIMPSLKLKKPRQKTNSETEPKQQEAKDEKEVSAPSEPHKETSEARHHVFINDDY